MTQQDIQKLKALCAKEGFDLVEEDGKWYIQQAECRIIWTDIVDGGMATSFRFQLSHDYRISFLKEELKDYLTDCLQRFLSSPNYGEIYIDDSNKKLRCNGVNITPGSLVVIVGQDAITGMPIIEPIQKFCKNDTKTS